MCLAILKPAGVIVPDEHLRNGWIGNPDGAGYGYVKDGKTVAVKGFGKLSKFMEAYKKDAEANPTSPFIIHFRIRSMGDSSAGNTHPFPIEGGLLIHNGTLSGTGAVYGAGPSDTALFADMFKSNLTFDFVQEHKDELNRICASNKLVMLYDNGTYQIVNDTLGVWVDGVWYSNNSYRGYSSRVMSPLNVDYESDWDGVYDEYDWAGGRA